jgi:hypothetical protein
MMSRYYSSEDDERLEDEDRSVIYIRSYWDDHDGRNDRDCTRYEVKDCHAIIRGGY